VTGGSGFIGTALLQALADDGWTVRNFDLKPAQLTLADQETVIGDLMDPSVVTAAMQEFAPDAVLHLAARTDTLSDDVNDYPMNMAGTDNVITAIRATQSVEHFIHTSTQYVAEAGADVTDPLSFSPFTAYGESKVASERSVRAMGDTPRWTIVRPTNIWGPRHPRYPVEFWRVLKRGLYVHPAGPPVVRTYGYVDNVATQYVAILNAPAETTAGATFYLGDLPIDIADWVDEFSVALRGHPARRVPLGVLKGIAAVGDLAKRVGYKNPPLSGTRLHSMTADYIVPTDATIERLGDTGVDLHEGVRRTVEWLNTHG
jgi:nucleoside-diphosphate-sugar epimerase